MKLSTAINDASIKFYVYSRHIFPLVMLGFIVSLVMSSTTFAGGTNHLAGLKEDVGATFGAGSDMQYFILLAEGLAGAYAYTKTKNIAVLAGVPVLMLFTHWALK